MKRSSASNLMLACLKSRRHYYIKNLQILSQERFFSRPSSICTKLQPRKWRWTPHQLLRTTFKLEVDKKPLVCCRVCTFHSNSFPLHSNHEDNIRILDDILYHKIADETLDELASFFEDLGDSGLCGRDYDASLASGVLTVKFGDNIGTYVINKQSPNKQIWLSSPKSGPKRYDIINGRWRYSHDGIPLHDLLTNEISEILGTHVEFNDLTHSHISTDGDNWA